MLLLARRGLIAMSLFSVMPPWLRRASAKNLRFADVAEFREFVITAFRKQSGLDSVVADPTDPAKLRVAMGARSFTCDVTNIFGYLAAYPNEGTDMAVDRFIRSMIEGNAGSIADSGIVAVIRTLEYVDYLKTKGIDILHEPLGADLAIVYMADRPDSMSPIKPEDLPDKDLQSIHKIALDNVRQWLPRVVEDSQMKLGVLYFVQDNTMLSTSLILLDEFWKSIKKRFPDDVLIALPRRDQLFIFDDGNPAAENLARHMIETTTRENFNLLSPELYARRSGRIALATK